MWKIINGYLGTDKDIHIVGDYYDNETLCKNKILDESKGNSEILKELQIRDIIENNREEFYEQTLENFPNKVFVYIAKIADIEAYEERQNNVNITSTKTNKVSVQHNAGLNLLKYAVKDKWDIEENLSKIEVSPNGKPYTDKYKFSISHCGELVCVAISEKEVGVDLECATKFRRWGGLRRKILTLDEQEMDFDSLTMTTLWTQKEAVFKLKGDKIYSPNKIDISSYYTDYITDIFCDKYSYVLTVATHEKSANYLKVITAHYTSEGVYLM